MVSFNSPSISQKSKTGILINQHITVQAAAEATGYNIQYLRRMLRSGALKGVKIGQMWLIDMEALETYLEHVCNTSYPPRHFVEVSKLQVGGSYAPRSQRRTEGQI
jgi:excisionase family DNA binding protein